MPSGVRAAWTFYWPLLKGAPKAAVTGGSWWATWPPVVIPIVAGLAQIFKKQLGADVLSWWQATPWWWGLVLIGLVFVYGFLKANYLRFQELEKSRDSFADQVTVLTAELRAWRPEGNAGDLQKRVTERMPYLSVEQIRLVAGWLNWLQDNPALEPKIQRGSGVDSMSQHTQTLTMTPQSTFKSTGTDAFIAHLFEDLDSLVIEVRNAVLKGSKP